MYQPRGSINAIATVLASVGLMACQGGDGGEGAATATATLVATSMSTPTQTSTTATPTRSLQEEVAEAYLAYWDAYAEAVLYLDVSLAEDFVTGEEFESIREEIEQLRADGVAARIDVEHDFVVADVSGTSTVVVDQIVNNSFYVDAETREPEHGEGTGEVFRDTFFMEKQNEKWVVLRGSREPVSQP
jgi:hypothetical protein